MKDRILSDLNLVSNKSFIIFHIRLIQTVLRKGDLSSKKLSVRKQKEWNTVIR